MTMHALSSTRDGRQLVEIDAAQLEQGFARRPFGVRHNLQDHPLLTVDAIADLAEAMPAASIERHRANLPKLLPSGAAEVEGPPAQTAREIEHNGCWMVLWYIEQVPEYAALLDRCLDEVELVVGRRDGGMQQREGFLFLSAPGAVTPAHFDPEHNLLLQIRGSKDMHVGRFADPGDQQRELDRYHDQGERNLGAFPDDAETFTLDPGRGVYVYPWAPHWVQNSPAVSVSLSITFRSAESARAERVHRANAHLRRLRLSPRPAGASTTGDTVKSRAIEAIDRARRARGRTARSATHT
jgi:hypothetical protein